MKTPCCKAFRKGFKTYCQSGPCKPLPGLGLPHLYMRTVLMEHQLSNLAVSLQFYRRMQENKMKKRKLVEEIRHQNQDVAQQCLIAELLYAPTVDGKTEKGKKDGCNLTTETKQRPFGLSLLILNGPWCV